MRSIGKPDLRVEVSKSSLAIVRIVLALGMLISFILLLCGDRRQLVPVVTFSLLQGLVNVWIFGFALEIDKVNFCYRTLFRGWRRIRLDQIEFVELQIGERKYRDKFRPPVRLYVKAKEGSAASSFDVNLKVFKKTDLNRLLGYFDIRSAGGHGAG